MPPAPTFQQRGTLPLFDLSSSGNSGLSGYWAGYRPGPHSALSGTATLTQVWQDVGGTYTFANARPADHAQFSAALDAFLAQASPTGLVRMLWIADATAPLGSWQVAMLMARATGAGSQISWTLARPAVLAVGEYAVGLAQQSVLTQTGMPLGFGIAVNGLALAGPSATFASAANTAWLPLAGPQLGCWCAELALPAVAGQDALAGLRVGLRYAAPHTDGAPGDAVDVLDVPVLAQGRAALTLHLSFDWLNPLASQRTRAGFFDDAGRGDPGPALPATLRTSRGYATTLAPRAHLAPLRPAALVLCRTPLAVSQEETGVSWVYHLAPDGAFDLAVIPPTGAPADSAPHRVIFGLSGLEYAALAASGGASAFFAAGEPAFAPGAAPAAPPSAAAAAALTGAASTAYLALLPATPGAGLQYYAQPRQAPLYAGGSTLGAGVLRYLEVPAATLPAWSAGTSGPPAVVPAAPLAGVDPSAAPLAERIEQAALAPARRRAIGLASTGLRAGDDGGTLAVTPQGVLVEVGAADFERVVLAALPGTPQVQLDISKVGPRLRGGLQSNELFFVVGDPAAFLADSSVRYRLDASGLTQAEAGGVPASVIAAVRAIVLPGGVPKVFATELEFDAAVGAVAGAYLPLLHELAGFLTAVLSGWSFQLSPRAWRTGGADPTVMIFKYANRSIAALIEDGGAWGWPEAAGAAQEVVRRTVQETQRRAEDPTIPAEDPYAAFYRDVLAEPSWNGVLFLNAPVSIAQLPSELQFIASGIDPSRFFAHHLGFAATPVALDANGAILVRQTAAFGLIDYQDRDELVLEPSAPNPDFAFKTLTLTARFANAALAGFSARVELMVNRLLGAPLTKLDPTHGNNLLLTGSSQRQGGVLSYAFSLEGEHRYSADRSVLDSIQIDRVQVLSSTGVEPGGDAVTTFALGGFLRFQDHPTFDVFGYGPTLGDELADGRLRFDELHVQMRFRLGAAGSQRFALDTDGVRLDAALSTPRDRALVCNFPVTLTGLASSSERSPAEAGFASISAPIDQSPLSAWWALSYRMDLGTLGALAGSNGLSLTLIAAWGAGAADGERPVYVGLELPAGMQWSLQGVMKLGFRSFQFQTAPTPAGGLSYVLRLRQFALQILGLSVPPGNLDVILFGDSRHPDSRVVGWYAAYEQEAELTKELAR